MTLTRRDLLKTGVFAGATLALPLQRLVSAQTVLPERMPQSALPLPFTLAFKPLQVAQPLATADTTRDYYRSVMARTSVEILPGLLTPMYTYNGTFPGPTIKVNRGREVVVRHVNSLPATDPMLGYAQWTSVHLHGSASLPQFDGYASDTTRPGGHKDYRYPNWQPGRTMWYHDHGVHHTGENVYQGLAAQYHIIDPADLALPIPHGDFDVPLVVSDAMFATDASLIWNRLEDSGVWGDVILVNGVPWPEMSVQRRKYRFRILNACVSRSFEYSLSTGDAMTVIGTDGGLMPAPQAVRSIRHGSAERYEVVIDFSKYKVGQQVVLRNASPKKNTNYANTDKIMAFRINDQTVDTSDPSARGAVPATLAAQNVTMNLQVTPSTVNRTITLFRDGGQWTVNGTTWEKVVASNYTRVEAKPSLDSVEVWTIRNPSGGWFHPFHIHLIDFKVLDRNGQPPFAYERGPKDTVYLGPNESVRVIMKFEGAAGKYMMHCHNVVHEDHDMMAQFEVVGPAGGYVGNPLGTPPSYLPERPLGA